MTSLLTKGQIQEMMIIRSSLFLLFVTFITAQGLTQNQKGLVFHSDEVQPGHILFSNRDSSFLINECGQIVHTWPEKETFESILDQRGQLWMVDQGQMTAFSWDGQVDEVVEKNENETAYAYDKVLLENGNILAVGRRTMTDEERVEMGFEESTVFLYYDVVIEVDRSNGEVIWEWRIIDHMIQGRDTSKENYGSIADHPELLNMDAISNFDHRFPESFMINGMDYNPELDQIILSIRKLSEIVIIDHSTTKEEAKGHTGGQYGRGGDILWRWGNPQNYMRGDSIDQRLFFQHSPNWIKHGEHKGKIMVFNNGLSRSPVYSSIDILNLHSDDGYYSLDSINPYGPRDLAWQYQDTVGKPRFYSRFTSHAQVMKNGNIYAFLGDDAFCFEVNPEKKIVWQYKIPDNAQRFKIRKYPASFMGFEGKDLTPKGYLESPPSTVVCNPLTSVDASRIPSVRVEKYSDYLEVINPDQHRLQIRILGIDGNFIAQNLIHSSRWKYELESDVSQVGIITISDSENGDHLVEKFVIMAR